MFALTLGGCVKKRPASYISEVHTTASARALRGVVIQQRRSVMMMMSEKERRLRKKTDGRERVKVGRLYVVYSVFCVPVHYV